MVVYADLRTAVSLKKVRPSVVTFPGIPPLEEHLCSEVLRCFGAGIGDGNCDSRHGRKRPKGNEASRREPRKAGQAQVLPKAIAGRAGTDGRAEGRLGSDREGNEARHGRGPQGDRRPVDRRAEGGPQGPTMAKAKEEGKSRKRPRRPSRRPSSSPRTRRSRWPRPRRR